MKIEVALTISKVTCSHGENYISLRIEDLTSRIEFVEVQVKLQDFSEILTGLGHVSCSAEVHNLENVGKFYEHKQIEFPLPGLGAYANNREEAITESEKHCPEGWECSSYFGSQNSFFFKDSKTWARCSIYRWVDK